MQHVLTLIAAPLTDALVERAEKALVDSGARLGERDWLAVDHACDLPFTDLETATAERAVRAALADAAIDLAAQPTAGRRKRLLLADMESTIIRNEMLDELADLAGVGARVAAITARAMNGEIDFRGAIRARVGLLAGQPASLLEHAQERIEIHPGAAVLAATLRAHGVRTVLVSGGLDVFVERIRDELGFDAQQSNQLQVVDDQLTGEVLEPILDRDAKLRALERWCETEGLSFEQAATVGDGANDLAMLAAAGLGVAFHAKPSVAATARYRIDHGDLTALLYLQGYRQDELASDRP